MICFCEATLKPGDTKTCDFGEDTEDHLKSQTALLRIRFHVDMFYSINYFIEHIVLLFVALLDSRHVGREQNESSPLFVFFNHSTSSLSLFPISHCSSVLFLSSHLHSSRNMTIILNKNILKYSL